MKLIYDGISVKNDSVVYNDNKDDNSDIMNILEPDIYKSEFNGNIYYFGYIFKDSASRKDRTTIIKWLKNIDGCGIDETTLKKFIDKPIKHLDSCCDLSSFDILLYPRSERSLLTNLIIKELNGFTQHSLQRKSFELIKNIPSNIKFDWETFDSEYLGEIGDNQYTQIRNYIENELLPNIFKLYYFSLADNVKPKYRHYVDNYLVADNQTTAAIEAVQKGKILIVDDINTSGSTLKEIIRIVKSINNNCEIFIFTLIGK